MKDEKSFEISVLKLHHCDLTGISRDSKYSMQSEFGSLWIFFDSITLVLLKEQLNDGMKLILMKKFRLNWKDGILHKHKLKTYFNGVIKLIKCWKKIIDLDGSYAEKWYIKIKL